MLWCSTSRSVLTLVAMILLVSQACGCGGGGGTSDNVDAPTIIDRTPDAITFLAQTTTQTANWIESNSVTISGINEPIPISVTFGEYSINGAPFTAESGSVAANQNVIVRHKSASSVGFKSQVLLSVGDVNSGLSASFSVTTAYDSPIFERTANVNCLAPNSVTSGTTTIELQAAFPQLPKLQRLVGLYQKPGEPSYWYAMLQSGLVYRFDNLPSADSLTLYLDISANVTDGGERGLLGMAFHPQMASNGEIYLSYTNNNGDSAISRIVETSTLPIDMSNEQLLLSLEQPAGNHNGGNIAFGPDGYLYVGFGDGGGANDTYNNGQNTQTLHSNILRLDVTDENYTIPADNPFVQNPNIRDEIYAFGLRNPWRWSFDLQTGDLWVGDVGQGQWEEINRVKAGDNLGWPIMEASKCFQSNTCDQSKLALPVAEYSHAMGCSVTGGFVYRGQLAPSLQGHYLYGDYCSGRVFSATSQNNQDYVAQELLLSGKTLASFAQNAGGEVLLLDYTGSAGEGIFRFIETIESNGSLPTNLSDTGCFESTVNKTYPTGVVPYNVINELWSDGADKSRFLALPDNGVISVLADGDLVLPQQSVLMKHFIYQGEYIETRLLMHHASGWVGYSYRWLEDQSDAYLLDGDDEESVITGNFEHIIPSRGQCFECHTGAANTTLGVEVNQLNSVIDYANANMGNQVGALLAAGYLNQPIETAEIRELAAINDDSASVEIRARSYLHSNCSGCHREGAQGASLDLKITTPLAETHACNVPPNNGDLGINNARIIALGDASRSVLLARIHSLDSQTRMPPLASQKIDEAAASIIADWITNLTTCD